MRLKTLLVLPFLVSCASTSQPIPEAWLSVPQAPRIRSLTLESDGKVTYPAVLVPRRNPVRVIDNMLVHGEKVLTERFAAIDSFDLSEERGEVVFSARRDQAFDIGLVSSDGSPVNWVPPDPADEVGVQWAPRGNKISFVIRATGGDVVRTVHVPTAAALSVPFPLATIHAVAWEPAAERYAVAYSTPDASDRVEVLKYDGEDRRMTVPPAVTLDVEIESFAGGLLMRPRDIRYDEKLPVVVWVGDTRWNDARAALMRNARVAVLVTKNAEVPGELAPWMDAENVFVVRSAAVPAADAAASTPALLITPDDSIPAGRYRLDGNLVRVAPAVIQSFAAGFIAEKLKRTTPTNGSSR